MPRRETSNKGFKVASLSQVLFERSPIPRVPSELQVIVIPLRKTGVVENDQGRGLAWFEFEMHNGIETFVPRRGAPCLNDALAGNEFNIPPFNQSAKGFECASSLRVDLGRQSGEGGELLRVEKHVENSLGSGFQVDLLV